MITNTICSYQKSRFLGGIDNLWTKIESLQWVLFVIFAIRNGKMVIV